MRIRIYTSYVCTYSSVKFIPVVRQGNRANRWCEERADKGRGGGRRGDMGVPYSNDSQVAVTDRLPSITAGTQKLPTYYKLY